MNGKERKAGYFWGVKDSLAWFGGGQAAVRRVKQFLRIMRTEWEGCKSLQGDSPDGDLKCARRISCRWQDLQVECVEGPLKTEY